MMKHNICDVCHGNVRVLNPFFYLDEKCEPTEEIEGYQVECEECDLFWDEYLTERVSV